jgi:DNA replication ATP-dependent helicase Dna2
LPDGSLSSIQEDDCRLRLRVIDIKLAAEPGANYFAEVVYYSMTLSAWLQENGLNEKYLVVATPAVWPGSYDASHFSTQFEAWRSKGHTPNASELALALEEDIEIASIDAYVPRLRRLLCNQIPDILSTPWEQLPYHVNYTCQGCEFLGYPWRNKEGGTDNDPRHCWPTAERCNHLSRIAGLSSGAALQLSSRGAIHDVASLAVADHSGQAFSEHQMLRAKGMIYPHRAQSLNSGIASVIPNSGGDALMPRWPDLRFYIFLDYDLSSAMSVSFGLRAHWREPLPYGSNLEKHVKKWNAKEGSQDVFLVDRRDLTRERDELLRFLRTIKRIMDGVRQQDEDDVQDGRRDDKTSTSSYQIYLWDEAQKKHLTRLISRHLSSIISDSTLRNLAWLFPPPELLASAENSSRQSPITYVSSVVQNTIAAPVPHHFTLLEIIRTYNIPGFGSPSVHPLYREPLTDLVPSERIYEYWDRRGNWKEVGDTISKTVQQKLFALGSVTARLEKDLKDFLPHTRLAAPPLNKPPKTPSKISPQGRLWYEFIRLNAALQALDTHTIQAMPSREREARFKSAILLHRLEGQEREQALESIKQTLGLTIPFPDNLLIYKLPFTSIDLNARDGDIGFALSPLDEPGFLDMHPYQRLTKDTSINSGYSYKTIADSGLTGVSIEAIDRINSLIVLKPGIFNRIRQLENAHRLDFSQNVILDPIAQDFLVKKVKLTLQAIGYPASATAESRILEALGETGSTRVRSSPETYAAQILWQASTLSNAKIERDTNTLRPFISGMNDSQWKAWEYSLTHKFTLIWGPPGTGKSWTLRNIILAALKDALLNKKGIRILISSSTYTAIDNVLLGLDKMLANLLPNELYSLFRLQSKLRPTPSKLITEHPDINCISFDKHDSSPEIVELTDKLTNSDSVMIVGATAHQLHNLAFRGSSDAAKHAIKEWFDFVVIDEASQIDVATSTLIFTKIAKNGSVVLAGDDLQLPPIHQADAPEDLEHLVGSIYNYFCYQNKIEPQPLQINYRSNESIVEFTKLAGYSSKLESHSPKLLLRLSDSFPSKQPDDWPDNLFWTADWNRLLDPNHPTTCFIYEDELSSQVNEFEADSISALIYLLYGRLMQDLANEKEFDGNIKNVSDNLHHIDSFWESAVGIVTPHRAQQSKIVQSLQRVFFKHPANKIRNAVDTVERFQGQERQVILASFGLGDPDMIQSEDEFLYSLKRFNVLASRARAKLIVFTTRTMVDHLSNDSNVLQESLLLKRYAEIFCNKEQVLTLGYVRNGVVVQRAGVMRYYQLTL